MLIKLSPFYDFLIILQFKNAFAACLDRKGIEVPFLNLSGWEKYKSSVVFYFSNSVDQQTNSYTASGKINWYNFC